MELIISNKKNITKRVDLSKVNLIGVILGLTGGLYSFVRYLIILNGSSKSYLLCITILLFSIIFVVISFIESINKCFQFFSLLIISTIFFFISPKDTYGAILFIIAILLGFQYDLFEKNKRIKINLLTVYYIIKIIIVFSIKPVTGNTIALLFFYILALGIGVILFKEELLINILKETVLKQKINELQTTLEEQNEILSHYNTNYVNPVDAGLTQAELYVLSALCKYKESNSELSKRLEKSPNTVKVQITRILNKIGADDRYQLIDLCQIYFIYNPLPTI